MIVALEEQVQRQFRGPSTPELLNADIAPLLSVCKKVGIEIEKFPTLNAPSKVVVQATTQRMRVLDMLDDVGQLTAMGSSKLSFDFSPEMGPNIGEGEGVWSPGRGSQGGSGFRSPEPIGGSVSCKMRAPLVSRQCCLTPFGVAPAFWVVQVSRLHEAS